MAMTKEEKNGIRIALDAIKKLQRYELCWEQMDESKDGSYIVHPEAINALMKLLKEK